MVPVKWYTCTKVVHMYYVQHYLKNVPWYEYHGTCTMVHVYYTYTYCNTMVLEYVRTYVTCTYYHGAYQLVPS